LSTPFRWPRCSRPVGRMPDNTLLLESLLLNAVPSALLNAPL